MFERSSEDKYMLVTAKEYKKLPGKVNEAIKDGWKPSGGVTNFFEEK